MAGRFATSEAAIPIDDSVTGQILESREGRILTADQLRLLAFRLPMWQQALENGIQSACFVPLITSVGAIGRLWLGRLDQPHFVEEDLHFLKRLAPEMAFALENTLAHQALTREKRRLETLGEIDGVLISKLELEKLLPAVSDCLARVIPHDDFAV